MSRAAQEPLHNRAGHRCQICGKQGGGLWSRLADPEERRRGGVVDCHEVWEWEVVDAATALVRYHMLPLPREERAVRRFVHRRRALLPDLLKLMLADREAARGRAASAEGRRGYRAAVSAILAELDGVPEPEPLLNGDDVMALLGLPPGPRVGEALAVVAEAQALGDVSTREEAELALLRYAAAQGWRTEAPIGRG